MAKNHLVIYSRDCLRCSHFIEAGREMAGLKLQEFHECHYENNNPNCPAADLVVNITGYAARLAVAVRKARDMRLPAKEAELLAEVAKEPSMFREVFYTYLNQTDKK